MPYDYIVQEWLNGKAGAWQRAAVQITGISLTTIGELAELRARVRVVGKLSKETAFYTSSK